MKRVQDYYFKKAKQEGFPARSVFKLKEAQARFRFMRPGHRVLDLGAAPGSWTKYASGLVGPKGLVVAVDLDALAVSGDNVVRRQMDCLSLRPEGLRALCPAFDVVLSDMAPRTTGQRDVDHSRSLALAGRALDLATQLLQPGGAFYCKVFQGSDFPAFRLRCAGCFRAVRVFKPRSSRPESSEVFLLGLDAVSRDDTGIATG